MRSLFAKILGWFVVALVVTIFATVITSIVSYNPSARIRAPFSLMISVGMVDAVYAWDTGGRPALEASLNRFRETTRASTVIFTDSNGTDLITGEWHPNLILSARKWSRIPFLRPPGMVFDRFSSDGKYCFFVVVSPGRLLLSSIQPAHLIVVLVVILLCYALAYYVTGPLRSLRSAVEEFGRGNLQVRAEEKRHDELGDLARSFNQMADRIETLLAAERRLLLDISHELRSPLARLSVAVELARSGHSNALPLDRVQKEADRLNDLISQMLQVARWEGDDTQRHFEPVRLDELVRELVNDCSIEASARDCWFVYPIPEQITVNGDPELLRRAIENVMRNAIRYAPSASKIDIALENGSGSARVRVRDYGPGVPDDALEHLFEPFYRVGTDRDRKSGGVGLGLSIARRAVELHHGKLAASNAQPGLQVVIELPA
jgi:two-component system sensor histidine kinase CpxA